MGDFFAPSLTMQVQYLPFSSPAFLLLFVRVLLVSHLVVLAWVSSSTSSRYFKSKYSLVAALRRYRLFLLLLLLKRSRSIGLFRLLCSCASCLRCALIVYIRHRSYTYGILTFFVVALARESAVYLVCTCCIPGRDFCLRTLCA